MTTSAAGLYGNYGQANYSAAKLGLLGLANTLAIEGGRRNIFVNTIAPVAGTRMTATVMPPSLLDSLKTEYIAPLVLYLCHESSTANGEIFEVGAGWVSNVRWQRSRGHFLKSTNNTPFSPDDVRDSWNKVVDFTSPTHPRSAQDSIGLIIAALEQSKQQSAGNEYVQPDKVVGFQFQPMSFTYTEKDVAFYALSIGACANPMDDSELAFVYENHPNFQAIPTFGIIFPFPVLAQLMSVEGLTFNPMMLLHGEQYLEIKKPIPTSGTLVSKAKVSGLYDKGKGVTVVIDATSSDQQTGEEVVSINLLYLLEVSEDTMETADPPLLIFLLPNENPMLLLLKKQPIIKLSFIDFLLVISTLFTLILRWQQWEDSLNQSSMVCAPMDSLAELF